VVRGTAGLFDGFSKKFRIDEIRLFFHQLFVDDFKRVWANTEFPSEREIHHRDQEYEQAKQACEDGREQIVQALIFHNEEPHQ
jgi:hypothetical protein